MHTVNLLEAKTSLSCLVKAIEQGQQRVAQRIGIAQGKFDVPDNIDANNTEVAHSFMAGKQCCKKEYM